MGFIIEMESWLHFPKSIKAIHHTNKLKKSHMVIPINAEKHRTKSNFYS